MVVLMVNFGLPFMAVLVFNVGLLWAICVETVVTADCVECWLTRSLCRCFWDQYTCKCCVGGSRTWVDGIAAAQCVLWVCVGSVASCGIGNAQC